MHSQTHTNLKRSNIDCGAQVWGRMCVWPVQAERTSEWSASRERERDDVCVWKTKFDCFKSRQVRARRVDESILHVLPLHSIICIQFWLHSLGRGWRREKKPPPLWVEEVAEYIKRARAQLDPHCLVRKVNLWFCNDTANKDEGLRCSLGSGGTTSSTDQNLVTNNPKSKNLTTKLNWKSVGIVADFIFRDTSRFCFPWVREVEKAKESLTVQN